MHTFHDYLGHIRIWAISDDYYWSYCPWHEFGQLFIVSTIQTISHRILTEFDECIHFMIISDTFAYERFPMIITGVIALDMNLVNFLAHLAKGHVSLWHGAACVRPCVRPSVRACVRPLVRQLIKNNISSETTRQILMKLTQKHIWPAPMQVCSNRRPCLKK